MAGLARHVEQIKCMINRTLTAERGVYGGVPTTQSVVPRNDLRADSRSAVSSLEVCLLTAASRALYVER